MKNRTLISILLFSIFLNFKNNAQVGISATSTPPAASAMLDVSSTSKGFLPPRMSTAQRNTLTATAAKGLIVYDTDENELYLFRGTGDNWYKLSSINPPLVLTSATITPITGINTNPASGGTGIQGENAVNNNGGGTGVYGVSRNTAPTGHNYGVYGENLSTNGLGYGIYGKHNGNGTAIYGDAKIGGGIGVSGETTSGAAFYGTATTGKAIEAINNSAANATGLFTNAGTADAGRFINTGGGAALSAEGNAGPTAYLHNNSATQRTLFVTNEGGFEAARFEAAGAGHAVAVSGNILTTGEIKPNGASGSANQVLTSNGNGTMAWASSSPTYAIGDFAQGGVVFWVSPDGKHGKVVSVYNIIRQVRWSNVGFTRIDGIFSLINGAGNTVAIIQQSGHTNSAAGLCYAYSYGGYEDWYLPAINELNQVYESKSIINTIALTNGGEVISNNLYWSSTENSYNTAVALHFANGSPYNGAKDYLENEYDVRPIRAF